MPPTGLIIGNRQFIHLYRTTTVYTEISPGITTMQHPQAIFTQILCLPANMNCTEVDIIIEQVMISSARCGKMPTEKKTERTPFAKPTWGQTKPGKSII